MPPEYDFWAAACGMRLSIARGMMLAAIAGGCGGRTELDATSPASGDGEAGRLRPEAADGSVFSEADRPASGDDGAVLPDAYELSLVYSCGIRSAQYEERSGSVGEGQPCSVTHGFLNTFSIRLTGSASTQYSVVVHCGYIRYDNGTFVGARVAVEARGRGVGALARGDERLPVRGELSLGRQLLPAATAARRLHLPRRCLG